MEEGRRLVPIDPSRDWGWLIVNYQHYRKVRDEEVRRSYFRDAQRKYRAFKKKQTVKDKVLTPVDAIGQVLTPASASASTSSSVKEEVQGEGKPALCPRPEDIYNAYPRKEAKPVAIIAIKKAIKRGFGAAFLLERTLAYSKTQLSNNRFTPHPATWFNQDRFNDNPTEWLRATAREQKRIPEKRPQVDPSKIDLPDQFKSWAIETYPDKRDEIAQWHTWADAPSSLRTQWWGETKPPFIKT
jgi:hypothetical protein